MKVLQNLPISATRDLTDWADTQIDCSGRRRRRQKKKKLRSDGGGGFTDELVDVCVLLLEPYGCGRDAGVRGRNVHVPVEREAGDRGGAPADRTPEDLHRPRAGEAG